MEKDGKEGKTICSINVDTVIVDEIKNYIKNKETFSGFVDKVLKEKVRDIKKGSCERCVYFDDCPLVSEILFVKFKCPFYETKNVTHKCGQCSLYGDNKCSLDPSKDVNVDMHCIFSRFKPK